MKSKAQKIGFSGFILTIIFFIFLSPIYAEVGVTDTSVKVALICDTTGPIAGAGIAFLHGSQSLVNYINETGGIHGRKVILLHESDNYSAPQAMAATKKLIYNDKVFCFMGTLGIAQAIAQIPIFMKEKIPFIAPGAPHRAFSEPPKRYVFPIHATSENDGQCMVDFMYYDLGLKNKKLALIYQDDMMAKATRTGMETQLTKYGLKLGTITSYKRGAVDLSSQVLKCKNGGAEVLLVAAHGSPGAAVAKEAAKMGWKPVFIFAANANTPEFVRLGGSAVEGMYVSQSTEPMDSKTPAMLKYHRLLKKHYPKDPSSNYSRVGFVTMMMVEKGLQDAGRDLTREKMVDSYEKLKNYETGVVAPITYGHNNRAGGNLRFFTKIENGKFKKLTEYRGPR